MRAPGGLPCAKEQPSGEVWHDGSLLTGGLMPKQYALWKKHEDEKMIEYTRLGYTQEKIAYLLSTIFMRTFTKMAVNTRMRLLKKKGVFERNKHSGPVLTPSGGRRTGSECKKLIPKNLKELRYHGPEHARYMYGVQTEIGSD